VSHRDATASTAPSAVAAQSVSPTTDRLFVEVYQRLKAMASRQRARAGGATLNTTAIVHELYVKLCDEDGPAFAQPLQFFSYAARAMRTILIDSARRRLCRQRIGLDSATDAEQAAARAADASAEKALEIDAALRRLERDDPRAAQLVELHYFAGLSLPEVAEVLGVTTRTLNRDWRFARAFLYGSLV
jgi:RNA polymerase sigma factor (TIGR02999 family)